MTKAFIKGEQVTYLADWDRKGSTYFRHAVVYSCGTKQMVLTDAETGQEMGRHFAPARGVSGKGGAFPRLSDEDAAAEGIALAEAIVASERAHFARCLAGCHGEGYNAAIRKSDAALHAPDVASYADRMAVIREAIARPTAKK